MTRPLRPVPRPFDGVPAFATGVAVTALATSAGPVWPCILVTLALIVGPLVNGFRLGFRRTVDGYVIVNGKPRSYRR